MKGEYKILKNVECSGRVVYSAKYRMITNKGAAKWQNLTHSDMGDDNILSEFKSAKKAEKCVKKEIEKRIQYIKNKRTEVVMHGVVD